MFLLSSPKPAWHLERLSKQTKSYSNRPVIRRLCAENKIPHAESGMCATNETSKLKRIKAS